MYLACAVVCNKLCFYSDLFSTGVNVDQGDSQQKMPQNKRVTKNLYLSTVQIKDLRNKNEIGGNVIYK